MSVPIPLSESTSVVPGDLQRQVDRHRETGWVHLDPPLRLFAVKYMEHMCHRKAAEAMERPPEWGTATIKNPLVRALISDLMEEQKDFSIQTLHFVRAKLEELLPKLMGEEEVPIVTGSGAFFNAKKFFPGEARATLESMAKLGGFIQPEKSSVTLPEITINFGDVMSPTQVNINARSVPQNAEQVPVRGNVGSGGETEGGPHLQLPPQAGPETGDEQE